MGCIAMRTLRRIGHAVVFLAIVLLVGVFVVQAFPQAIGADQSYVVLSGSMEPTISPGDVIIVSSVPASSIEANDIITYRRSGSETPVTHRVLEVEDTGDGLEFVTKGDANEDPDPSPVSESSLLGTVWFVIPYVGYVVQFANTRLGQILLVGAPLVLLAVTEIIGFVFGRDADAEPAATTGSDSEVANAVADDQSGEDALKPEAGSSQTESDTDIIAITTTDLRLSGLAFVLFSAYSAWMAYQHPGGLTIGVTMASISATLLVALVYLAGEPQDVGTSAPASGQATDGGVESARVDDGGEGR